MRGECIASGSAARLPSAAGVVAQHGPAASRQVVVGIASGSRPSIATWAWSVMRGRGFVRWGAYALPRLWFAPAVTRGGRIPPTLGERRRRFSRRCALLTTVGSPDRSGLSGPGWALLTAVRGPSGLPWGCPPCVAGGGSLRPRWSHRIDRLPPPPTSWPAHLPSRGTTPSLYNEFPRFGQRDGRGKSQDSPPLTDRLGTQPCPLTVDSHLSESLRRRRHAIS